jgi:hypothetical protein
MNRFRDRLINSFSPSLRGQLYQSTQIIAKQLAKAAINDYLGKSETSRPISNDFNRQRVLEMACLCRLAYVAYEQIPITVAKQLTSGQLFPEYQFSTVDFLYNDSSLLTDEKYPVCCGYVASTENEIFVILRGTKDVEDWLINLLVNTNTDGIHAGFAAYADSIWQQLQKIGILTNADSRQKKLILVGHSLGGAGVSLIAHQLSCQSWNKSLFKQIEIYTFGSPPVSTTELSLDANVYRIRNAADLIPDLPKLVLQIWGWLPYIPKSLCEYQHFGSEYVINGNYQIYQIKQDSANELGNFDAMQEIVAQLNLNKDLVSFEQAISSLVRCFYSEHRLLSYIKKLNHGSMPDLLNSMTLSSAD